MDIGYSSSCKFICSGMRFSTTDMETAIELSEMGFTVLFYYNGKYVGELVYGGEIEKFSEVPTNVGCGTTFFCKEVNGFVPIIQEEVYNSKPLVKFQKFSYPKLFVH